ncbi:hemophore-related protein [Mycolicibacter kumamotonensis]|uniref:Hemophore-related protein n=1 Tax=Mycolicibacter kumamotonensis TaxID=354243 RepID=A0A7K3LGV9_9MYCO|nr:hemophore-related protein [Mycolicibacter kumamotonensis]NDJ90826.1 hemophore-related protein [Mycolicibacter kumamotonensis]
MPRFVQLTATAAGCATLGLTAGLVVASADPQEAVNTTCSYSQVVSAMTDQSPGIAEQFYATPAAQSWLQNFLAAPPPQRQQLVEQAESTPEAPEYVALWGPLANGCDYY